MNVRQRIAVAVLTVSFGGFGAWKAHEGWSDVPYIPTKGDVPTIGYGSTKYEDSTPVKMTDKPIARERGEQLARNLMSQDEVRFRASLPEAKLFQEEYDLYLDFTGQYGIGNWRSSSMRAHIQKGEYAKACQALLKWRFQGGRDCSLPQNWGPKGCKGVWTRQKERHAKCMAAQ